MKCLVGLREGGILLVIANLPLRGDFCQSRIHALALRRANALEVAIGALQAN